MPQMQLFKSLKECSTEQVGRQ